jgi:hypothetical protein
MELVNLLLTGTAVSNVFDGCQQFGEAASDVSTPAGAAAAVAADGDQLVLRGVEKRARVGLLTLFEWYRYVTVGQNLKSPQFPWIYQTHNGQGGLVCSLCGWFAASLTSLCWR